MMTTVTCQRFSATSARWIEWKWDCDKRPANTTPPPLLGWF